MEPASIRYKNPGAMWGNALARKWGADAHAVTLHDGKQQGNNIAVFPTFVAGICAQLDLWRTSPRYKNKEFADAIRVWSGGNSVEQYISFVLSRVPGMTRHTVMNDAFWRSPQGIEFLKAQAWHEAGRRYPAPDGDWIEAQKRVFLGLQAPKVTTPVVQLQKPAQPIASPKPPATPMAPKAPNATSDDPEGSPPERIQPEDGSQVVPKSMATSKIGLTATGTGVVVAATGTAQVAKPLMETTTEVIGKVNEVSTLAGNVVETTKVVTTAVPQGFWMGVVQAMTSPPFIACVVLLTLFSLGFIWWWRRQHRQAGI